MYTSSLIQQYDHSSLDDDSNRSTVERIFVGSIAPHAISIALLIVAIVGYSLIAAFTAGGDPDPGAMAQFNTVSGTQLFPIATIFLTVVTAG